ncbi:MAG: SDR family NAD(P)-dependent oxidoreductase [Pleurocapsa sp. SU_196_0]|nr:SDR family NAD(P)-dependent oxidoreductase [Pleurocapsa sp. SU_196_0]
MLTDQTFIVTGAAGQIAMSINAALIEAGAKLLLVDRKVTQTDAGETIAADLDSLEGAHAMIAVALKRFGRIHGVIHTVGGFKSEPALEFTPDTYAAMFDTNVKTLVHVSSAALPELVKTGGFLGGIAAGQAARGSGAGAALYTAAKGAVALYLKSVAAEVKEIRAGVVYPMGTVDTPGNRRNMPNANPETWINPWKSREPSCSWRLEATTDACWKFRFTHRKPERCAFAHPESRLGSTLLGARALHLEPRRRTVTGTVKRWLTLMLVLATLFSNAHAEFGADAERQTLERGRVLTQAFYDGKLQMLWTLFDDAAKELFGQEFTAFESGFTTQLAKLGKESKLLEERAYQEGDDVYYERVVSFAGSAERFQLLWQLEGERVGLFVFKPLTAPSAPPEG